MVLPGHLAGGYIATSIILNFVSIPLTSADLSVIYTIGILSGEIPDIDLLLFYLEKNKNKNKTRQTHRDFITHIPMFWFVFCLTIFFIGFLVTSKLIMLLSVVILAGTFSHFILDSLEYGIQWFKPFSKRRYCLFEIKEMEDFEKRSQHDHVKIGSLRFYWNYVTTIYIRQVSFYAEFLVVIIAILVLFW